MTYIGVPWLTSTAVGSHVQFRRYQPPQSPFYFRIHHLLQTCVPNKFPMVLLCFHIKFTSNISIPIQPSSKESIQSGDSAWFERVIQQLRGVLLERQNDAAVAAVEASARPLVAPKVAPLVAPKAAPVSTFPTARAEARVDPVVSGKLTCGAVSICFVCLCFGFQGF